MQISHFLALSPSQSFTECDTKYKKKMIIGSIVSLILALKESSKKFFREKGVISGDIHLGVMFHFYCQESNSRRIQLETQ